MKSDWKNYKIGEFAKRSKIPTKVADSILYKRLTIRMHGLGIVLRDEISGSLIGTKNQFFAKGGQFLLSKIDARNGAFGIGKKGQNQGVARYCQKAISKRINQSKKS